MSRTTLRPKLVITNGSMAGDLTSLPTVLQSISGCSYALSWSGSTPVGTAEIQVSNDYALNPDSTVANSGTWTTVELNVAGSPASSIAISGNTGNAFIDIEKTMAYAIRLFYDRTSGTGTLNVTINGKVA